ncbi:hypothetical protein HBI59_218830 [Parastagonospora nodorum]|nr:hypothetical protein HBI59_218830 [Parastagonospora nodorum]
MTKESQQKLEENYFKVIDALTMTLIKDDDDLLGTINSYIKSRRLGANSSYYLRREADISNLYQTDLLLSAPDSPLDSDDYRLDSSSDINSEDNSEDEEATTAKDLAREQKERLKALLNAKTRDSLSARVGTAMEHCTLEE